MAGAEIILLDTHAWIWWVSDPTLLSEGARRVVDEAAAESGIFISSISVWEVAVLVTRGRLRLTMSVDDWVAASEAIPSIHFLPVGSAIALKSVQLQGDLHNNPADRIIIATAVSMGAVLVTKDEKMRTCPHVKTVW